MVAFSLQLGAPTATSDWGFQINRKKLEAAALARSPKLILLGGSATLFGIKASILEEELGVPAVNAGSHAALGMAYILENGKRFLRPGDTVVVIPEIELWTYGEDNRRDWASGMYVDYIVARDPDYFRRLPKIDQVEIALMTSVARLAKGLSSRLTPEKAPQFKTYFTYDPAMVDAHGDMTGHTAARRPASSASRDEGECRELVAGLPEDSGGLVSMGAFCRWAVENHIRVLAGFPNMVHRAAYDGPSGPVGEAQIRRFFSELGVPVIGSLSDGMMPVEEFFDTSYHPTEEASVRRTRRFAAELKPWLSR